MRKEGFYLTRLCEEPARDGSTSWFADHPRLPGCHAVGRDIDEAVARLNEARDAWLDWAQKHDVPVPDPDTDPHVQIQYALRPDSSAPVENHPDLGTSEAFKVPIPA